VTRYIALLRGVNVGGITVKSAPLAEVFRGLGFTDVRTVLASGNVAFDAGSSGHAALKRRIEQALADAFGYEAWIVLTTAEHVREVVDDFPFDAADPTRQPYAVFGSEASALDELVGAATGMDPAVDPVARGDGVVYWNPVKGTTVDTPFAKLLAKPRFKPVTTNRNLRTLEKMLG
jgi:uncharacterized protein (DUF1697 family)